MTLTNVLPMPSLSQRASNRGSDEIRIRALERLYERRAAVDELIESLENYQRARTGHTAMCVPFTAAQKCS